jgi:hypothetical protein
MDVERVILQFEKNGKTIVGERKVEGISLADLQTLFGESPNDPMYHSYDVTAAQVERLEIAANIKIDLDNYDYQLQAFSTN